MVNYKVYLEFNSPKVRKLINFVAKNYRCVGNWNKEWCENMAKKPYSVLIVNDFKNAEDEEYFYIDFRAKNTSCSLLVAFDGNKFKGICEHCDYLTMNLNKNQTFVNVNGHFFGKFEDYHIVFCPKHHGEIACYNIGLLED